MKLMFAGALIGTLIGAFSGTGTGIVIGGGGGMSGIWVFAGLFGALGFFAAPDAVKVWVRLKDMFR